MHRAESRRVCHGGALAGVLLACAALGACDKGTQAADGGVGDAATGFTVLGRLYPAEIAPGATYYVRMLTDPSAVATPVAESKGPYPAFNWVDYEVHNIPEGDYFYFALIDVDGSGGNALTTGDLVSWCYGLDVGNPPAAPNVYARGTQSVRFDCNLVAH